MAKFVVRLVGEDSPRTIETPGDDDTVAVVAKQVVRDGYLSGKMKTSERVPEPQEVAIFLSQLKWITPAPARAAKVGAMRDATDG
jgi:hypothetical protein